MNSVPLHHQVQT